MSQGPDTTPPPYHALSAGEVVARLATDPDRGLAPAEVARRRARFGANRLPGDAAPSPFVLLLRQFSDLLIVVLMAAALVAGLIGEALDAIAILVIVVLNGLVGFVQEYRAERALKALQDMSAPQVDVLRDGERRRIGDADLVPGDVVLLEAGNVVPADVRLVAATGLAVDEAALTGESVAVDKDAAAALPADAPLGDRVTLVHRGTHVTRGRAQGIVVAIGAGTELGRIAELMRAHARPLTPLQRRLARFSRRLTVAVAVICAVVFAAGLLRGEPALLMLLTAISLAVAAIPEALPAVVTVALGLGTKRLARHNALLRRLPAVETLGSVTTICCDKTGTLTENAMRAEGFWVSGHHADALPPAGAAEPPWQALGRAVCLNNDATAGAEGMPRGDPTEVALREAADAAGFTRDAVEADLPRTGEWAFDAGRRRMTTLHATAGGRLAIVKGAPEVVLPLCRDQRTPDAAEPLERDAWAVVAETAATAGYRLLAYAERTLDPAEAEPTVDAVERDMTFLGLVALADPPRDGVDDAVAACATAGIRVAMITGDHPATAVAIAARLGIAEADAPVVTGAELQALREAGQDAPDTRVFARVSPEQKLDIVTALQHRGEFVAMTGDGVNDAPALKQADIGVAMGRKGTDVAREAADMVLLDDSFATIVAAIREGRRIYDNIRKFIKYTMTSNSGEIWTILLAPFLGLPLPLLPIHILWINLVTDGLPGLALGVEPAERAIMRRPPRRPEESVFAGGMWQHMIWVGLLIGGLSLGAMAWAYGRGSPNWQTLVFTVLTLSQLVHALAIRSERESLFTIGWLGNPLLVGAVVLTLFLQLAVAYAPPLQAVFRTTGLTGEELVVALSLPWVVLVAVEAEKWLARRGWIYRQG